MCVVIEAKFRKYWSQAPLVFCVATILDHRLKLGSLELLLEVINNDMKTININNMFTIKSYLEELFTRYSTKMDRTYKQLIPMSGQK